MKTIPNSNLLIRRKLKSKAKTGQLYLDLMRAQLNGEDLRGQVTRRCRDAGLEPLPAMKGIKKYMVKRGGNRYSLVFSEELIEMAKHYNDEQEWLNNIDKQDKNIIISIILAKFYYGR